MNQRNRNERTAGQRGARVLIWLCVLVAQSLYAVSVLKLAGTAGEMWIIVTLSLSLVCVGVLIGFNIAGVFGPRRAVQNVSANRVRGWKSSGKPDGSPVRETRDVIRQVPRPLPTTDFQRMSDRLENYQDEEM